MRENIREIKSVSLGTLTLCQALTQLFSPHRSEGPLRQKAADRQPWHRDTKFFILVAQVFALEYQNQQSEGNLKEILSEVPAFWGTKNVFLK